MPPGAGRSTFVVYENSLLFGRPDFVLLSASPNAVATFRRKGLRLPSPSHAAALQSAPSNLSPQYSKHLSNELKSKGWSEEELKRSANIVHRALAIEVKVRDWRKALRQAALYQDGAGSAAVLLPTKSALLVSARSTERLGIGVIGVENGKADWLRAPAPKSISIAKKAWLTELLLRSVDER